MKLSNLFKTRINLLSSFDSSSPSSLIAFFAISWMATYPAFIPTHLVAFSKNKTEKARKFSSSKKKKKKQEMEWMEEERGEGTMERLQRTKVISSVLLGIFND